MVLGMSLPAFTAVHVLLSLVGIVAGLIAMWGLLRTTLLRGWTWLFLLMALATSITGFMFPVNALKPSHVFGVVTLVLLALAIAALVVKRLEGRWRTVYVVSAMLTLYLNVVVLIVRCSRRSLRSRNWSRPKANGRCWRPRARRWYFLQARLRSGWPDSSPAPFISPEADLRRLRRGDNYHPIELA
jgi:apolipoprotein N-acyltransferase